MGIVEKIASIESEISRTQKNKATEHHLGLLKAKLAEYRTKLLEPTSNAKSKSQGFEVVRSGDARIALLGFPSVGKSTLLSKLTDTKSETAAYEFTTLTCIPGRLVHNGAIIQLLDLPGIIEGASSGKGRGRQVISVASTADLILMILDATKGSYQRYKLLDELDAVGIRVNTSRPDITITKKTANGITFNATCPLTHLTEKLACQILRSYKLHNVAVLVREDVTVDQFIDTVLGNRKYIRCIYCYNKIDQISTEEVDRLSREDNTLVISCEKNINLDYLVQFLWLALDLIRIYTKKKGQPADLKEAIILKRGATIKTICLALHKTFIDGFSHALVWGSSAKHNPQRVGLAHVVHDEDIVQIFRR